MRELDKIVRVIKKKLPDAPHETLIVLDATTGQNALNQAKTFKDVVGLDGVILAKLDGTAKGGMVLPIYTQLNLPVKFIGLGEKMEDLEPFDGDAFVEALFEE
jgi:fused signal recognition particle receptor